MYSKAWSKVKINPKITVKINFIIESLFKIILWWDQVTKTPLNNKTHVLRRGTWKGSIVIILNGGQIKPKSFPGFNLEWKKAQNQALKNITSLKINKNIPHFNPSRTSKLWNPIFLSRLTSRHQEKEKIIIKIKEEIKINKYFVLKKIKIFKKNLNEKNLNKIGQGLKETKWNL
jgi:hypothetical protein